MDKTTQSYAQKILAELKRISGRTLPGEPEQEQPDGEYDSSKDGNRNADSNSLGEMIAPKTKPPETKHRSANQSKADKANLWLSKNRPILEFFGFLGILGTAIFALLQWRATVDAVQATRESNRITLESVRGRIVVIGPKFNYPVTVGRPISVGFTIKNVGHAVAIYSVSTSAQRWYAMPDGEMPIVDPVPWQPLEQDTPGSFGQSDEQIATQDYIDQMPTASSSDLTRRGVQRKITTFFFGKVIYESLGTTQEVKFCSFIAHRDSGVENLGNIFPDNGDPNFIFISCPKWMGIRDITKKER